MTEPVWGDDAGMATELSRPSGTEMMQRSVAGILFLLLFMSRETFAIDAIDRLTADRLEAVHQAVTKLKTVRRDVPRSGPLRDHRANLHVHSAFSHDSRG